MKRWKKIFVGLMAAVLLSLGAVHHEASAAVDFKRAKSMSFNKFYSGRLTIDHYYQVFKVKLPANGNLKITEKTSMDYDMWYLEIYNSKGERLDYDYFSQKKGYDSRQMGLKKGTYYITISGRYSTYKIKTEFKKSEYYEREDNGTVKKANNLKLGKYYYGGVWSSSDKDYFKFTLNKAKKVTVTHNNTPNKVWTVQIVNAKGKVYADRFTDSGVSKESMSKFTVSLKKGTYYLLVKWGKAAYKVKVQ